MGATTVPAASSANASDNWVLISSVSPTASTTSVSFTSISGYKKLLLKVIAPGSAANIVPIVRFNSDTAANYAYSSIRSYGTQLGGLLATNDTSVKLTGGAGISSNQFYGELMIIDTNTTGVKNLSGFSGGSDGSNTYIFPSITGSYFASAAITTVAFSTTSSNFDGAGTVALYGVAS